MAEAVDGSAAAPKSHASKIAEPVEFVPNGLMTRLSPLGLEHIYDYSEGGHHPVHLGDVLHSKYKVIHKLGSGGFANVWLCRDVSADESRYLAVKILLADESTDDCAEVRATQLIRDKIGEDVSISQISSPVQQFDINGPNGRHLAFVYPLLGPVVSRLLVFLGDDKPGEGLRKACRELTEALSTLHKRNFCHGDFRPGNILARVSGIDCMSEDQVLEILGRPQQNPIQTRSGAPHNLPCAPQYAVYPIDWDQVAARNSKLVAPSACLIDFGESFEASSPPERIGIPKTYAPPELILDSKVSQGCDLWALACTLFEVRTGEALIGTMNGNEDDLLCEMVKYFGPLPEPWWSEGWKNRMMYFHDEADELGRGKFRENIRTVGPMSLVEKIEQGLFSRSKWGSGGVAFPISKEEAGCFADLLTKLMAYAPEKRISAREALEHEWFQRQDAW